MNTTLNKQELKYRAEAKRKKLEARIAELKADASKKGSETLDDAQNKLDQLNKSLKEGWDNMSDATAERLNRLLRD